MSAYIINFVFFARAYEGELAVVSCPDCLGTRLKWRKQKDTAGLALQFALQGAWLPLPAFNIPLRAEPQNKFPRRRQFHMQGQEGRFEEGLAKGKEFSMSQS